MIGGTCKGSNVLSEAVLMVEGLIYPTEILIVLLKMILILFSF